MKIKRALISVADKRDMDKFVKGLHGLGIAIMCTGGTREAVKSYGLPVIDVSEYTGFPEMLNGRVKTLHPKIHAGILALRDSKNQMKEIKSKNIFPIDMVVVNLYPFEKMLRCKKITEEELIENIDIGGAALLRSAGKNFKSVAVISSPEQYVRILDELKNNACVLKEKTLRSLAAEGFKHVSRYDHCISQYLEKSVKRNETVLPDNIWIELEKVRDLRYGENPHQRAAFYRDTAEPCGVANTEQVQGKPLSFNNILDLSVAQEIVADFKAPCVSIVKHTSPCAVASCAAIEKAYLDALDCDRMSAFGSIMGFNRAISKYTAELILKEANFIECIIAPEYTKEALEVFRRKVNLRILKGDFARLKAQERDLRQVEGGMLCQDKDKKLVMMKDIKIVTKVKPSKSFLRSLLFGWKTVKYVKSNAIVLCKDTKTVGIGAGQMSRVDSVIIAILKAGEKAKGSILASDAFFPKTDSIEAAYKAGIAAIIQPGGSIRDNEIIAACDHFKIPMVFTGIRHFRH